MTAARRIRLAGRAIGDDAFPLIITPLVGGTPAAIREELVAILPKAPDMLEWRIDFFDGIGDVDLVIDTAREIRAAASGVPVLLTRRKTAEGGQPLAVDEATVIGMYEQACKARCVELIDYELSNAPEAIARLRRVSSEHGIAMVMSYHNFQKTPGERVLHGKFSLAQTLGADIAKVAVMPQGPADVLRLLAATQRASETLTIPLISMSMGGIGSVSRMISWVYGSAATFAIGKASSAPGQVAIDELRAVLAIVRQTVLGR